MHQKAGLVFFLFSVLGLIGCAETDFTKDPLPESRKDRHFDGVGNLLGEGALTFGQRESDETGIGVNSYLWRGSLTALSFMPLQSADPFGGLIMTDWYAPPIDPQRTSPAERFKATVLILSKQLRSDGLQVQVFCQEKNGAGEWVDIPANPRLQRHFEESILLHARQLKAKAR